MSKRLSEWVRFSRPLLPISRRTENEFTSARRSHRIRDRTRPRLPDTRPHRQVKRARADQTDGAGHNQKAGNVAGDLEEAPAEALIPQGAERF